MVKKTQEWLNKTYKRKKGFTKFTDAEIDGITGQGTFKRLIQALQIELNENFESNLTVDGDFGKSTLNAIPWSITREYPYKNIVKIIQGSFWCKGYSAGPLDGIFGNSVESAVKKFEHDAGLTEIGVITPVKLQGIMNTDAYFFKGEAGSLEDYQHRVQKEMNKKYCIDFGLVAPNGIWERKSHKMLIKCCQKAWGISNPDGVWGNGTKNASPVLASGSANTESVQLLSWALAINGFYTGETKSTLDSSLENAVRKFQEFMCISKENVVGKGTWAALLSSKGDTGRDLKALDTATKIDEKTATYLKEKGYTDIGRYLTNAEGSSFDKKMTPEELEIISKAGLKVFPIYQTRGNNVDYFMNSSQGVHDAAEAMKAAHNLSFPYETTIYFAVDYDVRTADIEKYIIPYFENISRTLGSSYQVGVYGPRAVCNVLAKRGLANYSFVADMSSGFTCNIGQPMPNNWAYEQVVEVKLKENGVEIGIDKCAVSPRGTAIEWEISTEIDTDYTPVNEELANEYEKEFTINGKPVYDEKNHCFGENTPHAIVYERLKNTGLNIYAIAGIMGNLQAEGFDPKAEDSVGAFGIAQWQGSRKANLRSYAGSKEKMEQTNVQIEFLLVECTHGVTYSDPQAADGMDLLLKSEEMTSARYASDIFTSSFERPTNHATWEEVENAHLRLDWDTSDRYESGDDGKNSIDGLYYIDSKKRRGCAEACYRYLIDIEKNH